VRIRTDEGLSDWAKRSWALVRSRRIARHRRPEIAGKDPLQIEARNVSLANYLGWSSAGVETRGNSAIDLRVWDVFGKAHGRPVCEMLGGKSRDS
jgi:L-alanine-DL-glutamate epimerase-like enolase superfamily enzyme